jgi:phenylpropionate dioxygenase-like ring-hydroxylating dioxygenase large terminal subunit
VQPHAIEAIRASHEDGRPLPGFAYRDEEVFSAEVETLLHDNWISVGCGHNVSEPGDLFPVQSAGRSLLVVRADDGEIRVFYNLCRHRGAPLAYDQCRARAGRIVCPYHAWSFGLDGKLLSAPHLHRGEEDSGGPFAEEREDLGLLPVRAAVWRDIVFVNLSSDAPPFEDFIRPLDERLGPWTADELRPLSSDEYEIQANWKLAAENFLDAYHLPVVHPETGLGFGDILEIEDVELSQDIFGVALPQGYGEGSEYAATSLPRFSGLEDADTLRIEVYSVFPNTLILVEPDNQQVIVLRPQSPGITHETFANYLVSDASQTEELAKERDELYQSAIEINDQDASLLARLQMTRSMDVGDQTQLAPEWDLAVQRFQRRWARKLLSAYTR